MNITKYRTIPFLFICWLLLTAGCTSMNADEDTNKNAKKVTVIHHLSANTLDPHNSWAALRAGAVETLVKLDSELKPSPWLAAEWKAQDKLTWLFTIRENVIFHDGSNMDAAAVKSSLERALEANPSLSRALNISSMEAQGQQLTIVTAEPNPALPSELVNPYTSIISTAAENKVGTSAFNYAPIGTGPFRVTSFAPDREIKLIRYEGYWDAPAILDEVSYQFNEDANVRMMALQSKEVDIAYQLPAESLAALEKDNQFHVKSIPGLRVHYFIYNASRPHMKDIQVRKALDLLINRETIAQDLMLGHAQPANGPFPTILPFGSDDKVTALNSLKASELLTRAGYQRNSNGKLEKDGSPLKLQLITYKTRPELPLIAQLIQSEAAKLGMEIEIKLVENVDAHLRESDQWDLVTYSNLSAPRGDGGYFLNAAYQKGGALNPGNVEVSKLTPTLEQLNSTESIPTRIQLSKEAVSLIQKEVPHSYLVYPNNVIGVNNRVLNWTPGAEEYYIITNKLDVN
ncbi:nickel ABC transporter substrate-binding protein [Paenibacillus arenosi]|uniref:ABC transporter substrate-binding protein n=1 Tax=Paenibacillus arenosi TaxID=2774142 RepID=A0ABR9ATD1_9BACL|nr:nickel ABC transporter substrate-binding protein [Paenibacillus arenosi]MBD8497369.1 ABC transporter substrate-binding protein [Paenibacillus arenosi]